MKQEEEFHVSRYIIVYKLTLGLIEFTSGLGIALLGKQIMARSSLLISRELFEDPHDLLANFIAGIMPKIFTHNNYLVLTLVLLGCAKIAGAIGLIFKRNWGVDLLVGLTALMLPFQLVNLLIRWSIINFLYISTGILIALYLIQFQPKAWISRIFNKLPVTYTGINNKKL